MVYASFFVNYPISVYKKKKQRSAPGPMGDFVNSSLLIFLYIFFFFLSLHFLFITSFFWFSYLFFSFCFVICFIVHLFRLLFTVKITACAKYIYIYIYTLTVQIKMTTNYGNVEIDCSILGEGVSSLNSKNKDIEYYLFLGIRRAFKRKDIQYKPYLLQSEK